MTKWIEPSDSPIWRSLSETHPHLEITTKQQVFLLLQDSEIPPTDKIFPWVVETIINRVSMEMLGDQIESVQKELAGFPRQISQALGKAIANPIQVIQSNQTSIDNLTMELRKNAVIQSSLRQSGWRGLLCSLEAIAQHKILGLTVLGIAFLSALVTGGIIWKVTEGDRQLVQFNRQAIQNCYQKFAVDKDGNGWFSCSGIQLPIQK